MNSYFNLIIVTTYWAPLLHIYQPPWQDVEVLRRINKECYTPLFSMLERHPNARITLNIQGCLLDMLHDVGLSETLYLLKSLVDSKKVELIGSAKYHPILPLIPKSEIRHQISMNEVSLRKYFGNKFQKNGFFPPEMAVSTKTLGEIKANGYDWAIMGGIANAGDWPQNYVQDQESGLKVFFRDDYISNEISFDKISATDFVNKIGYMSGPDSPKYVITAQDGETFGHHIPFYETTFLGKAISLLEEREDIKMVFVNQLIDYFPTKMGPDIHSSTWSTDGSDLASNVPYPLWKHPFNTVHKVQFRMLNSLYKLMDILEIHTSKKLDNPSFENYYTTARHFYDQALHSCWLWWASMRPHWSPNLIYKGVDLIMKTALNAELALINIKVGDGNDHYENLMGQMEKIMNEMVEVEIAGQRIRTF